MKRILALLLALIMLLTLAACGKDEESTPTGESTGATTNTTESTNDPTDGTQDSTQGTTEGTTGGETTETTEPPTTTPPTTTPPPTTPPTTTPPTTTPPTTTPPTTEAPHTHSYSSKVTTSATCGKEGVKTFTCSCGDSYTEKIAATGQHSWGSWSNVKEPTFTENGKSQRTCKTCSATESTELDKLNPSMEFWDTGLHFVMKNSDGYNQNAIKGDRLLDYAAYKFVFMDGMENPSATFDDVKAKLKCFNLTDAVISQMKQSPRYQGENSYNMSYTEENPLGNPTVHGFVHNGGNNYTVYYAVYENWDDTQGTYWKVELEYNKGIQKYTSIVKVESIPTNITK